MAAGLGWGTDATVETIASPAAALDRNEERHWQMSRNGRALLNGRGVLRCVDAVNELLARIRNTG